jgi:hypothetical protein
MKMKGKWLSNREDGLGEYYNTNPNNPYMMNMREPVANTVKRSCKWILLPYRIHKDSAEYGWTCAFQSNGFDSSHS